MPPPPPPPPAPPPVASGAAPDRNALLSQIRKGRSLKKVETNDRSAPALSGGKSSSSVGGSTTAAAVTSNGPTPPFIPPGGLFAHGIPKLRATGSRPATAGDHRQENQILGTATSNRSSDGEISSESIFGVGMSRSQPPSPLMKARQGSLIANRNFPSDLNIKGPAPVPPPASQKPRFSDHEASRNGGVANIRRSLSQTGLGTSKMRPARPPPNIRPPPPPKNAPTMNRAPPPPPLKPPNVKRRQSFGVADAASLSVYNGARFPGRTAAVPQPPPRNNSVPNSLNQVVPNSSPSAVHVNKMATAPPPPPPSRPVSAGARPPVTRPPPPPSGLRSTAPPPPPPPHRSPTYPAPPSQLKATASVDGATPTPPQRVSSVMSSSQPVDSVMSDFEARFYHKFQGSEHFPLPERFTSIQKTYPSRASSERSASARRQPPPPPPPTGHGNLTRSHSVSQTRLHIQLDARVFANNTAHC